MTAQLQTQVGRCLPKVPSRAGLRLPTKPITICRVHACENTPNPEQTTHAQLQHHAQTNVVEAHQRGLLEHLLGLAVGSETGSYSSLPSHTSFESQLASLPTHKLCLLLLNTQSPNISAYSPSWFESVLDLLITRLEKSHSALIAAEASTQEQDICTLLADVGIQQPSICSSASNHAAADLVVPTSLASSLVLHDDSATFEHAVQLLPSILSAIVHQTFNLDTQKQVVRALALVYPRIQSLQHDDIARILTVLLNLQQTGSLHLGNRTNAWTSCPDGEHGLLLAVHARVMELPWTPTELSHLAAVTHALAKLGAPVPAEWLANQLQQLGPESDLDVVSCVPAPSLNELLQLGAAITAICASPVSTGAATDASNQEARETAKGWLRQWFLSSVEQYLSTANPAQIIDLLKVVASTKSAAKTIADGAQADRLQHSAVQVLHTHFSNLTLPPLVLVHLLQNVCWAGLPTTSFYELATTGITRLTGLAASCFDGSETLSVVKMLSAVVQRDATLQPLAQPLLVKVLPASKDLLPSFQTQDLIQIISALSVLEHTPQTEWQAMFFYVLKSRSGLLQPDDLLCVLGAVSCLRMTADETWLNDVFPLSRKLLPVMDAGQVTDLVWALGQQAPCMDFLWAPAYESHSMQQLSLLSPTLLAGTIKALVNLSYRPTKPWLDAFVTAVQAQLFAPGAVQMCALDSADDAPEHTVSQHMALRFAYRACSATFVANSGQDDVAAAARRVLEDNSGHVSVDALMTIVDALSYTRVQPTMHWMHDFTDAIRCKLSLLSGEQLNTLLLYVVSAAYKPQPEWWHDYLAVVQPRLSAMNWRDLTDHMSLLSTLGVQPEPEWLTAWCNAIQERLCLLLPQQLHQVLACLAACNHTPSMPWIKNCMMAVEHVSGGFEPSELVRSVVILDRMGATPSIGLLSAVYNIGMHGLQDCDTAVLAQLPWCLQAAKVAPSHEFMIAYCAAAQTALPQFSKLELESVVTGLHFVCSSMADNEGEGRAASVGLKFENGLSAQPMSGLPASVSSFTVVAREFLV